MFELKIDNAKYWRDCVESIVNLVDEGSFNITKEGISLKAMDPSSISMVAFNMPAKAFSKYSVDKNTSIGLNIENLSKILSRTRDDEALVIRDVDNKVLLEFIGPGSRRRYKLQMIDVKKNVEKEPSVVFDAHVEMVGEPLKDMIKDANLISSYIAFKASKDQFAISARGDSGELEELHEREGSFMKKVEATKNADATFNLEFLENMVKACPIGTHISIDLKTNEPLKMTYKIGEAEIAYFLAPYMEE
ncbi:MAG: proliferating cell nuclear antigen (pcna) [Candidatus Micrarchaeota archaeon]|nr:proliferating cell nuclear antigen (pcna) [Candidatus Micrarchaeota archaeon]MDE1834129.1 proliferating cell nuclear antigen (pcna) [Candidatus Micrarchaeota archaeon]MDE1859225.1 proliferating cell nuclear antigen (pcna) [Candidatus Micrarchaeota archaeon]